MELDKERFLAFILCLMVSSTTGGGLSYTLRHRHHPIAVQPAITEMNSNYNNNTNYPIQKTTDNESLLHNVTRPTADLKEEIENIDKGDVGSVGGLYAGIILVLCSMVVVALTVVGFMVILKHGVRNGIEDFTIEERREIGVKRTTGQPRGARIVNVESAVEKMTKDEIGVEVKSEEIV